MHSHVCYTHNHTCTHSCADYACRHMCKHTCTHVCTTHKTTRMQSCAHSTHATTCAHSRAQYTYSHTCTHMKSCVHTRSHMHIVSATAGVCTVTRAGPSQALGTSVGTWAWIPWDADAPHMGEGCDHDESTGRGLSTQEHRAAATPPRPHRVALLPLGSHLEA